MMDTFADTNLLNRYQIGFSLDIGRLKYII